jgi:polysaccharide biosynthesis protein PslG
MYLLQRKLIALTFLVAAALAVAQPAGAARRDFVGISSDDAFHGSSSYRSRTFGQQQAAGVQLLRQNFDWAAIERSPGRYTFRDYDGYVGSAASHGLRLLPVLYHPPDFRSRRPSHGAERGEYPPNSYGAMGAFAAALVRRYGPNGSFWRLHPGTPKLPIRSWQVWNEPSLPVYWRPRPSVRSYVRLLKAVRKAVKREDRRAEIVTAGIPPSKLRGAIRLERFLRGMYRAGGRRAFSTLAVNSYARNSSELSKTVRRLRRIMRRYHDRRKRIWITELGWATGGPPHRFNIGTAGQAQRIKSVLRWVRHRRQKLRLRGVVYFQWRDQRPYPPTYKDMWGLHTGLLDLAGRAKPGLVTFANSARRLH